MSKRNCLMTSLCWWIHMSGASSFCQRSSHQSSMRMSTRGASRSRGARRESTSASDAQHVEPNRTTRDDDATPNELPHNENDDFASVTFETRDEQQSIEVRKGTTLRTSMLKNGLSPHNGRSRLINCRGLGTCGTCAVEIYGREGTILPTERTAQERIRLNFPPHNLAEQSDNLRLACQVQVHDDVVIRKRTGFWGQDTSDELAEAYPAELWFGDLEFILDGKSPNTDKTE